MIEIPIHGLLDSGGKIHIGFPSQAPRELLMCQGRSDDRVPDDRLM